ncbi:MBL fold metallo-hydrolase [Desulfuromonas acetoxidans]|uniref:Beta-lactamase-like n=1 Tax=Desulfuromonas acetoxidans (strain DSM 684 / 11070) TaxID=281689 RepID=Q1K0Z0_DESA6|nr:MBL fold metallo-hydrolase [Desulfuromonas acetoxidans]EAT16218.1 beta-lactamase-like [Desulfuromonas acetoxidans DSM 684]MBF0645208.1 MBL fold metallo-hydrolase [Desulfuromonas acetoxidans]NVD23048.1 MBL fold metallo-hydrolase [Desulfuromonas acetoxidans]NVE15711.1 MBL fold metallo-hydrolase [Desulfuromonas acetoxidans]
MLVETLAVGPLQVNCYLVACPRTKQALVIDPGDEGDRILEVIDKLGLKVKMVVNTHGHFDHVGANHQILAVTGVELCMHRDDLPLLKVAAKQAEGYGLPAVQSPDPKRFLENGDLVEVGDLSFEVIHTPGHSPGGICLYGEGHLFSGDTLFASSIGRTDLPGGDMNQLLSHIRSQLMVLPDATVVHPGHGPESTIGREKTVNPFLNGDY